MTKLFHILLLLLCGWSLGCSTTYISSGQSISLFFDQKENHTVNIERQAPQDFFLWGLYPGKRELALDKAFSGMGLRSVAELEIEETRTGAQVAWMALTLGFYTPKTYVLRGKIENFR